MEYTTNLNLKKPDVNEYYDIEKNNENMDLIDEAVGELNKNKITVQEKDQIHFVNDLVLPMSSKTNSLPIYKMHMEWHSSDGWCMIIYYYYNGEYYKGRIKLTETAKI